MTKTRRMIAEQLKNVDAVCEILDARIPISSRNPDVDELTAGKPRLVVLNRVDQADPDGTKRWAAISALWVTRCWSATPRTARAQPGLPEPCGSCWRKSSGPTRKRGRRAGWSG